MSEGSETGKPEAVIPVDRNRMRGALENVRALNLSIELELEAQRVRSGAYDPPGSATTPESHQQAAHTLQQASILLRRLASARQGEHSRTTDGSSSPASDPPAATSQTPVAAFSPVSAAEPSLDRDSRVPRCPHCGSSQIIEWVDKSEGRLVLLISGRGDEATVDAVDTKNVIEGEVTEQGLLCDACDRAVSASEL